jgi:hypothetical protein
MTTDSRSEKRLSKTALNVLAGSMQPADDTDNSVSPVVTHREPVRTVSPAHTRVANPQLYGFVDPDLKAAFVAKVKASRFVNANILVAGLDAWSSDTEWTPIISQWVYDHAIDLARNRIVKSEVFTARVGAPVPADLHIRIQEACERTSVAIQNLIYVIVSHFVTDDAFADYLIDKAIARKVARAEDSLKGLSDDVLARGCTPPLR